MPSPEPRFGVLLTLTVSTAVAALPPAKREAMIARLKQLGHDAAAAEFKGDGRIATADMDVVYSVNERGRTILVMCARDDVELKTSKPTK